MRFIRKWWAYIDIKLKPLLFVYDVFPGLMPNVTPLLLPHIYQFAILENSQESLNVAQKVWFDICDLCPLEPLLLAGCAGILTLYLR